jgi:hypothetical protein
MSNKKVIMDGNAEGSVLEHANTGRSNAQAAIVSRVCNALGLSGDVTQMDEAVERITAAWEQEHGKETRHELRRQLKRKGRITTFAAQKEISVNTCCCPAIRSGQISSHSGSTTRFLIAHNREAQTWTARWTGFRFRLHRRHGVSFRRDWRWRS